MSTDYYPHCFTCDDSHNMDNVRYYGTPDLFKLVSPESRAALEHLAAAQLPLTVAYDDGTNRVDLYWFTKHKDHDIGVINEYNERTYPKDEVKPTASDGVIIPDDIRMNREAQVRELKYRAEINELKKLLEKP